MHHQTHNFIQYIMISISCQSNQDNSINYIFHLLYFLLYLIIFSTIQIGMTKPYLMLAFILLMVKMSEQQPTSSDSCVVYNSTGSVCQQCLEGFYLQFFFCIPCNPLCSCTANTTYCDSCLNVTYQNRTYQSYRRGDVCVLCNTTIPFCAECPADGLNCTHCIAGRYLTKQGFCSNQTCTSNCELCKNQTACLICAPNYFLTDFICNGNCSEYCYACIDNVTCQECMIGYYLLPNATCDNCTEFCAKCSNSETCQECIPSYFHVNGTCIEGVPGCLYYTGGYQNPTCLVCLPGFSISGGSCSACVQSGCLLCSQQFICITPCLPGNVSFNFACISSEQSLNKYYITLIIFLVAVSMI